MFESAKKKLTIKEEIQSLQSFSEEEISANLESQPSNITTTQKYTISDEIRQLVRSSISSAINAALSDIHLSAKYFQPC